MALTQQKSGAWINTPSHLLILTLCPCVLRRSAMLHEDFQLSGTFGWNLVKIRKAREAFVFRAPVILRGKLLNFEVYKACVRWVASCFLETCWTFACGVYPYIYFQIERLVFVDSLILVCTSSLTQNPYP